MPGTLPWSLAAGSGLADGAVSAMYGVAYSVNAELKVHDLTHEITPFAIWEASYRLIQTIPYWPEGTVFVSVVDPGVGSDRKSIVARTKSGKYIVTPDNGTLTHVLHFDDIAEVREIDEKKNRLPNSGESYTFHGRDVYAFTGARLASGIIDSDEREIVLKKTEGYEILSIECLPYEICNCISKMIKRNMISMEKGLDLFEQFESIDISYIAPDFETTLKIAGEEKHYSYDAFYIENALRLGVPVLSLDKGLIAVAEKRGVTCL